MAKAVPVWQHSFTFLSACRPNYSVHRTKYKNMCMLIVCAVGQQSPRCGLWLLVAFVFHFDNIILQFQSYEWTKCTELFETMTSLLNISEQKSKLPVLSVLMREIISIQSISRMWNEKKKIIENCAPNRNTMPIKMPNGF